MDDLDETNVRGFEEGRPDCGWQRREWKTGAEMVMKGEQLSP